MSLRLRFVLVEEARFIGDIHDDKNETDRPINSHGVERRRPYHKIEIITTFHVKRV